MDGAIQQLRHRTLCGLLAIAATLAGCDAAVKQPAAASPARSGEEIWEAFYLQGAKVGYGHTSVRPAPSENGEALVEVDSLNHIAITRFGQKSEHDVKMRTIETPEVAA